MKKWFSVKAWWQKRACESEPRAENNYFYFKKGLARCATVVIIGSIFIPINIAMVLGISVSAWFTIRNVIEIVGRQER